tara:strand:- start:4608 stop:5159 length:552 start_codon:yes stop_codon:yes gene_type:complete
MELKKPKFSKKEVSQKFNLKDIFGVDFSKNSDLRDQIGQAIIDRMLERTASSKDLNGRDFKAYSTGYKNSDDYKDFKSSSKVNMDLKGNMLEAIDIINDTVNTIKVGFDDELETKKAFRHNTGDKGMTKRTFFGVNKSDINAIKKEFKPELADLKQSPPKSKVQTIGELLAEAKLLEELFGEG